MHRGLLKHRLTGEGQESSSLWDSLALLRGKGFRVQTQKLNNNLNPQTSNPEEHP